MTAHGTGDDGPAHRRVTMTCGVMPDRASFEAAFRATVCARLFTIRESMISGGAVYHYTCDELYSHVKRLARRGPVAARFAHTDAGLIMDSLGFEWI